MKLLIKEEVNLKEERKHQMHSHKKLLTKIPKAIKRTESEDKRRYLFFSLLLSLWYFIIKSDCKELNQKELYFTLALQEMARTQGTFAEE